MQVGTVHFNLLKCWEILWLIAGFSYADSLDWPFHLSCVHLPLLVLLLAYLCQLLAFLSLHSLRPWQFPALCSKKWWNEESPTERKIWELYFAIKVPVMYLYLSSWLFEGLPLDSWTFSGSSSFLELSRSPPFSPLSSRIIFISLSLKICSWKSILRKGLSGSVKIAEGTFKYNAIKIMKEHLKPVEGMKKVHSYHLVYMKVTLIMNN